MRFKYFLLISCLGSRKYSNIGKLAAVFCGGRTDLFI
jgi:hypothetical protein